MVPPYRLPGGIRYLSTGIRIGTRKKGRFEPSQALALMDGCRFDCMLNLRASDERVRRYLKGETISLAEAEAVSMDGWVLVCVDGHGLGWAKYTGGNLKNKYYPGWRLQ